MVFIDDKCRIILSLKLLLLLAALSTCRGQQVGVSLRLQGVIIPNNSLISVRDILYRTNDNGQNQDPSNKNSTLQDQALLCVTDLTDCCRSPRTRRGEWYYPNGRVVQFDTDGRNRAFRRNRGANEVIGGRQFYGSIRLFRRFSPPERGRFRCELPSAANPTVNQTLHVYILSIGEVTISPSGSSSGSPGDDFSLTCSAATINNSPLPSNVPSLIFEWFYGPSGNASLPFGVTPTATISSNGSTYTSTLQFSPLNQSHAGMYTCRLGAGRLVNSINVTVNAPSVTISANLNNMPLVVGQTGIILTCKIFGADNLNPTITYQWTRNNGTTQISIGTNLNTLSLPPLQLSDAGFYLCRVTSALLNNPVTTNTSVIIQVPDPQHVTLTSSLGNIVISGSNVTLTCSVQMNSSVTDSEVSLLTVDAQLVRQNGITLNLSHPDLLGTIFIYNTEVKFFDDNDAGNYTCMATVRRGPFSIFLTGIGELSGKIELRHEIGIPFTTTNDNNAYSSTHGAPSTTDNAYSNTYKIPSATVTDSSTYRIPSTTVADSSTYRIPSTTVADSSTYRIPSDTGNNGILTGILGVARDAIIAIIVLLAVGVALIGIFWLLRRRYLVPDKQKLRHPPVLNTQLIDLEDMESNYKPAITKFPSNTTVTEGEGVYFKIKVSGEPQPTVTWYHNGELVREDYAHEIETDGCLAIPSTELKHSGVYKAVVVNQYGSKEREVKLIVNEEGGTSMDTVTSHRIVSSRPLPIPEFGKYIAPTRALKIFTRLWTLEREDTALNMLPAVKQSISTDLGTL